MRLVLASTMAVSLLSVGPWSVAMASRGGADVTRATADAEGPPAPPPPAQPTRVAPADAVATDVEADVAPGNKPAPPAKTSKRPAADVGVAPSTAYFDMGKALNSVHDAQRAKDRLQTEFASRQKSLDEMQESIKSEQEEFVKQEQYMTPEQRNKKERELQERVLNLRQTYMKLQQELMEEEQKLTQEIGAKLREAVRAVAQEKSYDVVFNIDNNVLVYPSDRDITFHVITAYNNAYGGGGGGKASRK